MVVDDLAAAGAEETVTAVYQSGAVADAFQDGAATGYVVNATAAPGLAIRFSARPKSVDLYDCTGRKLPLSSPSGHSAFGIHHSSFVLDVPVPPSGLAVFRA